MNFPLPQLGEGVYEAELVAWRVQPGDPVKRGQYLMEVMTDKATMEVPSPFAGVITALNAQPGQTVKVGEVVLTYDPPRAEAEPPARVQTEPRQADKPVREAALARPNGGAYRSASLGLAVAASPAVRYMARKLGIDLTRVRGSGPQGRILIDDLSAFVHTRPGEAIEPPAESQRHRIDYGTPGSRIKLIGVRRKTAEHMVVSKRTIPHYTYVDECDFTEVVRLREQLKEPLARQGVRLTYLAFLVKAVVAALRHVPIVNSTLDESAGEIILHDQYHIGIAVAATGGLVVPVIHDADKKNVVEIAREIERLSADARHLKSRLEDLRGGTFTITSIGSIGGLISTPVINHPEVGILGVGKVIRRPIYDAAGQIKPADLVYLSVSLDHRVVDGAIAAVFCNAIIKHLQTPAALLV